MKRLRIMNREYFGIVALGMLVGLAVPACGSSPAVPSEETGLATQAWNPPIKQLTSGLGGGFHQEIAVGHSTIVASNTGTFAFFNRSDGSQLDAKLPMGNAVSGTTLFGSFFLASSPNFINKNLPTNQAPAPGLNPWTTCDATQNAPVDGAPLQNSSCITQNVYDTHTTYDPVHQRFILAGHVRNMNWTFPTNPTDQFGTVYTNPGSAQIDPYSWRYVLFAVSISEDPTQGFWLYQAPEYYGDWPRVGVSGNYFVVSNHNAGSTFEYDNNSPMVVLYLLDDLVQGVGSVGFVGPSSVMPPQVPAGTLRTFGYTQADLLPSLPYSRSDLAAQSPGFLVVPAHDEAPDPSGPLVGTAYVMSRSAHGEVPTLFGFVPGSNPSIKPTVISAPMPSTGFESKGVQTYANLDPTSATIRGGYLYSTYEYGNNTGMHLDQQQIATTHSGPSASLALTPTWGAVVGAAPGSNLLKTAPVVEATADGSAVLGYSVMDTFNATLGVRSMTFSANGSYGPEIVWSSGPYNPNSVSPPRFIDSREVNRQCIDPADPQAVWILGVAGTGGANDTQVTQQVFVNPPVAPSCTVSYGCDGMGSPTNKINCDQPVKNLTLLRLGTTGCSAGQSQCWQKVTSAVEYDPYTWFDDYAPPPGTTTVTYQVYVQDSNGSWAVTPAILDTVTTIDCSCWTTTVCQLPSGQQINPTVNSPPNWCSSRGGHLVSKTTCPH
jgi:hypothetical protein